MIIIRRAGVWYAAAQYPKKPGRIVVGYYEKRRIEVAIMTDLQAVCGQGRHWYTCAPIVLGEGETVAESVVHGFARVEP